MFHVFRAKCNIFSRLILSLLYLLTHNVIRETISDQRDMQRGVCMAINSSSYRYLRSDSREYLFRTIARIFSSWCHVTWFSVAPRRFCTIFSAGEEVIFLEYSPDASHASSRDNIPPIVLQLSHHVAEHNNRAIVIRNIVRHDDEDWGILYY